MKLAEQKRPTSSQELLRPDLGHLAVTELSIRLVRAPSRNV